MKKNIKIGVCVTKVRNRSKSKRSYGDLFLKEYSMRGRGTKAIYVREEFHERIAKIAHIIGDGEIPLYAYLDNILKHHFELFGQEITEDFNKKNKLIF